MSKLIKGITDPYERAAIRNDRAIEAMQAGFKSKAAQKEALDELNHAYEEMSRLLADKTTYEDYCKGVYPSSLCHWREKHVDNLQDICPEAVAVVVELAATRAEVKGAPINKPAPKAKNELAEAAVRRVKSIMEQVEDFNERKLEAETLLDMFGGLSVSASAHWVHGHKGARFIRHFWYLNGRLTALNTICGIVQKLKDEGKLKDAE